MNTMRSSETYLVGQPGLTVTFGGAGVSALLGSGVLGRMALNPPARVGNTTLEDGVVEL